MKLIHLIVAFSLVLACPLRGSLSFTQASTNKVTVANPLTYGSGTTTTYVMWIKQRATPNASEGWSKAVLNNIFVYSGVSLTWRQLIDRATTDADSRVLNSLIFPNLNEWRFVGITYSEGNGVKIYYGGLNTTVAEASDYVTQTVGAGATNADTSDLYVGNRSSTDTLAPAHDIAFFALYDTELTLGELRVQQFSQRPIKAGCKTLFVMGASGTTTQVDWSGNAKNSTITGASVAAHAPLPPPLR